MKALNKTVFYSILISVFAASNFTLAEEQSDIKPAEKQDYITPQNMTMEDREMLNEHSQNYNNCLTVTSLEQMKIQSDPRHVVDFAMKHCASGLEDLHTKMVDKNFDPGFIQAYLRRVSNHGANSVLRVVMVGMANQSQQPEDSGVIQEQ